MPACLTPGSTPAAGGTGARPFTTGQAVLGVLMNDPAALAALGSAVHEPPYKAPPRAPVLFVKPRNTWACSGADVIVPDDAGALRLEAHLALVIGRTACRVRVEHALGHLAGVTLAADLSVPHDVYYRPSVRHKARDGSCLLGPVVVPCADPDAVAIEVRVDGERALAFDGRRFARSAAALVADVSEFMTLHPGDVLLAGTAHGAPCLTPGQRFEIEAGGIGVLTGRLVADAGAGA